jgi:hypothetical protein|tara:strand:- start:237 stop:608 length:372 start_codon:yes stop_codon:yes gene_type:complete
MEFTSFKKLVNDEFTVVKNNGYKFKKWDVQTSKMLVSESPQQGFRKVFTLETDKGMLDASEAQLGQMLSRVIKGNVADISNVKYKVGSNGKTGMEIRYFISPVIENTEQPSPEIEEDISNIEF